MDADDAFILSDGERGYIRHAQTDAPTVLTRAIFSIRLRALQGRVHAALYSDTRRDERSTIDSSETVVHLRQQIEQWKSTLPALLPPSGPALSLFMTSDWSSLVYNQALLHLYRPQLTSSGQNEASSPDAWMTCARAASEVCSAFRRQYLKKQTTFTWGAVHELFLAGLTFVYCVRRSDLVRSRLGSDYMNKTCTDCTIAFVILAERSKDALPYRDLFEALSTSTMNFISEQRAPSEQHHPFQVSQEDLFFGHNSIVSQEADFPGIVASFSEEVNAPERIDDLLDAILVDWN